MTADETGSSLSDILRSPGTKRMGGNHDDLPGSVGGSSPDNQRRPSTSLEIGPNGEAAMSDGGGLPSRLPPLRSQDGDGLDGYRQNLDFGSEISQVKK